MRRRRHVRICKWLDENCSPRGYTRTQWRCISISSAPIIAKYSDGILRWNIYILFSRCFQNYRTSNSAPMALSPPILVWHLGYLHHRAVYHAGPPSTPRLNSTGVDSHRISQKTRLPYPSKFFSLSTLFLFILYKSHT